MVKVNLLIIFLLSYVILAQANNNKDQGDPAFRSLVSYINDYNKNHNERIFVDQKIKIGEKFPNIEITDILNKPGKKIKISDLKGKLIIFDFWSTTCGSCIAGMPKMQKLKQKYGDKIEILLINPLDKIDSTTINYISGFSKRNPILKNVWLPLVLDTNIRKVLDFRVAYQAWVDPQGILRAITNEEYVNPKEIDFVLSGGIPNWPINNKHFYDLSQPLLIDAKEANFSIDQQFKSAIRGYLPEIESAQSLYTDTVNKTMRFTVINLDKFNTFKIVATKYEPEIRSDDNRIIISYEDSSKFIKPDSEYENEWARRNAICYEILTPIMTKKAFFEIVIKDLNDKLKLNARIETRNSPILELVKSGNSSLLTKDKNLDQPKNVVPVEYGVDLANTISKVPTNKLPFVDSRQISAKEQHKILYISRDSLENINAMAEELNRYGMQLKKSQKDIKLLILSE